MARARGLSDDWEALSQQSEALEKAFAGLDDVLGRAAGGIRGLTFQSERGTRSLQAMADQAARPTAPWPGAPPTPASAALARAIPTAALAPSPAVARAVPSATVAPATAAPATAAARAVPVAALAPVPPTAAVAPAADAGKGGEALASLNLFAKALPAAAAAVGLFSSVAAASPATMERFNLALGDIAGVVGQSLTPVVEVLTEAFRFFGDVLASMLPSAGEMREALKPVTQFLDELRETIKPLIPIVKDVLTVALKALGQAVNVVLVPFRMLASFLRAFLGEGDPLKSSVGAKATSIAFTSPDAFARSVYQAAFKAGLPTESDPVVGKLGEIFNKLTDIARDVGLIARRIVGAVEQAPTAVVSAAVNAAIPPPAASAGDVAENVAARTATGPLGSVLGPLANKAVGGLSGLGDMFGQGVSATRNLFGFQDGLWNVPSDNLPARLHRGEMVVPAKQAEKFRQFDGASNGNGNGYRDDNYDWLRRHINQAVRRAVDGHSGGY